jgi:hypothetical protein
MKDYVHDTYVNANNAVFSQDIWNCYGMPDHTKNICEGCHIVINEHFRHRHLDPYAFETFLLREEMTVECRTAQIEHGHQLKRETESMWLLMKH